MWSVVGLIVVKGQIGLIGSVACHQLPMAVGYGERETKATVLGLKPVDSNK